MKTLVIGAGAVGGYLGAKLLQAGHDVTLVARGAHAAAMKERGLFLERDDGVEQVRVPRVVAFDELRDEPFELVLLGVKAPALPGFLPGLPRLLGPGSAVVPLQNGLDSEAAVASVLGPEPVVAATVYMASSQTAPGRFLVRGTPRLAFAPYERQEDARLPRLRDVFVEAGVPTHLETDYRVMLWSKLVWNAPFNGICALTGALSGDAVATMEPLARAAMAEVIAVAKAEGVALPDALIDTMIAATQTLYARTEPSMLQDVRAGRPAEIDALQEAVVTRGARRRVPTPVLATLASLLRGYEAAHGVRRS